MYRVLPLGRGWKSKPSQSRLSCNEWHCLNTAGVKVHHKEAVGLVLEDMLSLNKVPLLHFSSQKEKRSKIKAGWGPGCAVWADSCLWWIVRVLVLAAPRAHRWAGTISIYFSSVCKTQAWNSERGAPKEKFLTLVQEFWLLKIPFLGADAKYWLVPTRWNWSSVPRALLRTKFLGWKDGKAGQRHLSAISLVAPESEQVTGGKWGWKISGIDPHKNFQ